MGVRSPGEFRDRLSSQSRVLESSSRHGYPSDHCGLTLRNDLLSSLRPSEDEIYCELLSRVRHGNGNGREEKR